MAMLVLFIALFFMLIVGVPVGFAIGGATMVSMFAFTDLNMVIVGQYNYSGISSFTVMAIPFSCWRVLLCQQEELLAASSTLPLL